jgi:hypothetical protein
VTASWRLERTRSREPSRPLGDVKGNMPNQLWVQRRAMARQIIYEMVEHLFRWMTDCLARKEQVFCEPSQSSDP